jgi:hypothetical protein
MTPLDQSLVFIVGAQRSGTTWLQRLLAAHPAVVGSQESHLFSGYVAPLWQRWQEEHRYRIEDGRTIGLACYLDEDAFLEQLRQLARSALSRIRELKPEASLIVEKTPDHGLHLPLIHRLFPDAVILHVLRDGRDVTASLLAAHHAPWGRTWAPETVVEAASRWDTWVRTIQRDLPLFERTRTIRYEELSARGETILAELYETLGVPLPSEQVRQIFDNWGFSTCRERLRPDSLVLAEHVRGGLLEPDGFHRSGRSGGWRDTLSTEDQQTVEERAGELLRELGYEEPTPDPVTETVPEAVEQPPAGGLVSLSPRSDVLWAYPQNVGIIDRTNAQMVHRERLLLYSTILALVPERCLEVGVCEGGSSRIIHAALNDVGQGRLVSIDPQLRVTPEVKQLVADRVTFLQVPSPGGLETARELAGGLFDFVLLDGDHSETGVFHDLLGLVEVLRPGAVILAHDAYYSGVECGVWAALNERLPLIDAGLLSTTRHPMTQNGEPVAYGGFRMLVRSEDGDRRRVPSLVRRVARRLASLVR